MIRLFLKHKKFKEYISWSFECGFGAICATVIVFLHIVLGLYNRISVIGDYYQSFLSTVFGSSIGLLGVSLAGVALFSSVFDASYSRTVILVTNDINAIERLYTSFLFLSFNTAMILVLSVVYSILLNSGLPAVCAKLYHLLVFVYAYLLFFDIGYVVGLIRNAILLVVFKRTSNQENLSARERAIDIRIDMIIGELITKGMPEEEAKQKVITLLREKVMGLPEDDEQRDAIVEWLKNYYMISRDDFL